MRKQTTYQIVIVFVVDKIFLGEKVAESRVAKSMGFTRAELKHGDSISGSQIQAEDLENVSREFLQSFLKNLICSLPEIVVEQSCC
jgi:hypothetical protein